MTAEHCMIALLWSEADDDGEPLDSGDYEPSPELEARVAADWDRFRTMAEKMGFGPSEALAKALHPDCGGDPWNQVAHDFILTRNGHGAGFWDGGWHQPWADRLTEIAERFVEIHPYVGEDGMIYPD
jgi:hypothetical protein